MLVQCVDVLFIRMGEDGVKLMENVGNLSPEVSTSFRLFSCQKYCDCECVAGNAGGAFWLPKCSWSKRKMFHDAPHSVVIQFFSHYSE